MAIRTSLWSLKLLAGAGWSLSPAVVGPHVEGVEAEGLQARHHAVALVLAEVKDLLLHVMRVVLVEALFLPVVQL